MRHFIITLFLVLTIPLTAVAQKELSIGRILDGHYKKNPAVTDVEVMGDRLRDYGLNYYHSFTVKGDVKLMQQVIAAFVADEAKAADKEVTKVGGKLISGMYRLKYDGNTNRFLFFKDMRIANQKQNAVMVIYMEGDTSLKSLQRKFKK